MLRFAPSPTSDMNIDNLRVALYNFIVSKQEKEDFIVRIEDIEKEKNIEGKDKEILELLAIFGIEYTQVIYQSERVRFHTAMALQLIHEKKAFSCFCSPHWLESKKEEAKTGNIPYKYDDACANLPAELVIDNTNPFTIRVHKSKEDVVIKDYARGEIVFKTEDEESFLIMQENKTPTCNFATAVDDMLSDISIIVRDEKHIQNTSKQDHIRNALAYDKKINYAHLPSILNDEAVSIKWLLEEGYLPEAISNYLILTSCETPKEIFTLSEALTWLDLSKLSQSSVQFDIKKLRSINQKHLSLLDAKELSRYVGFADEEIGLLANVYLNEVATTKELKSKIGAIFAPKTIPPEFTDLALLLTKTIKKAPYFEQYEEFENYIAKETKLKKEDFLLVLRLILTGDKNGPDITQTYKYFKNYIGEIVK